MTNAEKADKLLKEAELIAEGIPPDLKRGVSNLAIRRSQEVVELALKAILCEAGVEYPKIHDVAPILRQVIGSKNLSIEVDFLDWLEKISSDLASKRSPAFYPEAEYEEAEATDAMNSATKVLDFARVLIAKLRDQT